MLLDKFIILVFRWVEHGTDKVTQGVKTAPARPSAPTERWRSDYDGVGGCVFEL